jgi:hypothetical protein
MGVGVQFCRGGRGPDAGDGRERRVGCDASIAVWDVRAVALLSTNYTHNFLQSYFYIIAHLEILYKCHNIIYAPTILIRS